MPSPTYQAFLDAQAAVASEDAALLTGFAAGSADAMQGLLRGLEGLAASMNDPDRGKAIQDIAGRASALITDLGNVTAATVALLPAPPAT